MDLSDVYSAYREHYYIGDTKKIDVLLATLLSNRLPGKPVWILMVGPSGIGKTMLTDPADYAEHQGKNLTRTVSQMTKNTLVSGQHGESSDLAPELDGKVLYIPDFSTIVDKQSKEQREIFSQFRDLYDGRAKKDTGNIGPGQEYEVRCSFIGCVTNGIYQKQLVHQSMGTRFIMYRIQDYDQKQVENAALNGLDTDDVQEDLGFALTEFLNSHDPEGQPISDSMKETIKRSARWTAKMRASGDFDSYHGELKTFPQPEKPTRLIKQYRKMAVCLLALSEDYGEERAEEVIMHIARSCVDPLKTGIYDFIASAPHPVTVQDVVEQLRVSKNPVRKRVQEMHNVGVLSHNRPEDCIGDREAGYSATDKLPDLSMGKHDELT